METFTEILLDYGFRAIGMLLGLAGLYLYTIARQFLTEKLGQTQFQRLVDAVELVVRAIEQEGGNNLWSGEQKREIALLQIYQLRDILGLKATDNQIGVALEAAVQVISAEQGKFSLELEG